MISNNRHYGLGTIIGSIMAMNRTGGATRKEFKRITPVIRATRFLTTEQRAVKIAHRKKIKRNRQKLKSRRGWA